MLEVLTPQSRNWAVEMTPHCAAATSATSTAATPGTAALEPRGVRTESRGPGLSPNTSRMHPSFPPIVSSNKTRL